MLCRQVPRANELLLALLSRSRKNLSRCSSSTAGREQPDERLRILFCGSEQFSAYSLQALAKYARSAESNIESIDVVTRNDKLVGRGLKHTKPTATKKIAEQLRLPLHQIDTFTGWAPPSYGDSRNAPSAINLIIAVSFGLLVPPRILRGATYGGLNVHPSLLPQLKGAAPIQWAIMHGLKETGVTVQTLHETKFDEGLVLSQIAVPIEEPDTTTVDQLRGNLGPIGADLLVDSLRVKRYMSQDQDLTASKSERILSAPKIEKRHMAIDPETHSAQQILRMWRAFRTIWAHTRDLSGRAVRVMLEKVAMARITLARYKHDLPEKFVDIAASIPVGMAYGITNAGQQPQQSEAPLLLNTIDGFVEIQKLTVSGSPPGHALASAAKGKLLKHHITLKSVTGQEWNVYTFCAPLRGEVDGLPAII